MSRTINRLSARKIEAAKPEGDRNSLWLADGGNLYLQITRGTDGGISKSWVFRYERGKRHDLGLGSLNTWSLAEARERARELRQGLDRGIDPMAAKEQAKAERAAQAAAEAKIMTFEQCAGAYIEAHSGNWTNRVHRQQWSATLEQYVYPTIGRLPVDQVDTGHIVKLLTPIWKDKRETASRVRGRIEKVLGWATASGLRSGDNPARWPSHLQTIFPDKAEIEHHAALPYAEVPAFLAKLGKDDRVAARAIEFMILTAARKGEVWGAAWDEFNLAQETWTIPGSRMKAGEEHRVPLSDRTLKILRALLRIEGRVFPIGKMVMLRVLQGLQPDVTLHGFRTSFRDWAAERTHYPELVAEQALAHRLGDKTAKAYRRTDLFEKRRRLMAEWSQWCSRLPTEGAKVVSLRR